MKSSQMLVFMALGLLKETPHYLIDMASCFFIAGISLKNSTELSWFLGKTSMNGAIFHSQSQRQWFMSDQQCSNKNMMHFWYHMTSSSIITMRMILESWNIFWSSAWCTCTCTARAAGSPGGPAAIREPLARPVTKPVVEPTALALREPSTSEAQRLQVRGCEPWRSYTRTLIVSCHGLTMQSTFSVWNHAAFWVDLSIGEWFCKLYYRTSWLGLGTEPHMEKLYINQLVV